jgi:hypothetical protein
MDFRGVFWYGYGCLLRDRLAVGMKRKLLCVSFDPLGIVVLSVQSCGIV